MVYSCVPSADTASDLDNNISPVLDAASSGSGNHAPNFLRVPEENHHQGKLTAYPQLNTYAAQPITKCRSKDENQVQISCRS